MSIALTVEDLQRRVDLLERRLSVMGMPLGEWVSPNQAQALLSVTRAQIMREIRIAEYCRITGQDYEVKLGVHYRRPARDWQVCIDEYEKILAMAPEMRTVVDVPRDFKV